MFSTYILESRKNNKYYIGSCESLNKRVQQHNQGKVVSTSHGIPWVCVHEEKFKTRQEAVAREQQIKKWKNRRAIKRPVERSRGSSTRKQN